MNVKELNKKELDPGVISFLETYGMNVIWVQLENPDFNPLHWETDKGDWIDLKLAEDIHLRRGEYYEANMGIAARVHKGYEVHIEPRSSTYKRYHIIMANEMGIVDNSYSGSKDIWHFPMLAMEDTKIAKETRIAQFRLMPNMKTMFWGNPVLNERGVPKAFLDIFFDRNGVQEHLNLTDYDLIIVYTDDLGPANRGGLGSTGI